MEHVPVRTITSELVGIHGFQHSALRYHGPETMIHNVLFAEPDNEEAEDDNTKINRAWAVYCRYGRDDIWGIFIYVGIDTSSLTGVVLDVELHIHNPIQHESTVRYHLDSEDLWRFWTTNIFTTIIATCMHMEARVDALQSDVDTEEQTSGDD